MRKLFTLAAACVCSLSAFAAPYLNSNPDSGTTVTELTSIEIMSAMPRFSEVDIVSTPDIIVKKDGVDFCGVNVRNNETSVVTLTLKTPATEDGVYTVVFPVGCFELWDAPSYISGPLTMDLDEVLTFTIGASQPVTASVSVTPEDNSVVTAPFSSITLTSTDTELTVVDPTNIGDIKVYQGEAEICGVKAKENTDGSLTLNFAQALTEAGTYTVKIPDGAIEITNESYYPNRTVGDLEYNYMIQSAEVKPALNVTPAAGDYTEPISSITLTSATDGYPSVDILSSDDIMVYLDGAEFCGVRRDYAAQGTVLKLKETMTESGEYKVVFPAGSWSVGNYSDEDNPKEKDGGEFEVIYNVDLGGPKYNIEIPEGKLTPNSTDGDIIDLGEIYDGALEKFYLNKVSGELYAIEGATVNVYNKRAGYNVEATVTSDTPKKAVIGNAMTTNINFLLPEPITVNGTYTVVIPRGVFGNKAYSEDQNTGEANKAYTFYVTFTGGEPEPEPSVKFDLGIKTSKPAEGVVDLSSVVWEVTTFGVDAEYDLRPNSTVEATIDSEAAGYHASGVIKLSMATDFTRTFKFVNKEPSKNGTYIMTIPAGTFGDAEWLEDPETGHTNPEIKVYYLVKGASGDITTEYDIEIASTTPANESTVDIAENELTVSFTAAGEYSYYPNMKIAIDCEGAEYKGTAVITGAETADGVTTFTTTLSAPITVNGEYTMTLPQGMFGDADYIADWTKGHANAAATYTFTVTGGAAQKEPMKYDLVPTVTPADGDQIEINTTVMITFVFPEGTVPTTDDARASLKCQTANYFDTAYFLKGEANGTYVLKFGTIPFREGTYTMTIAEGTFVDADEAHANPELNYSWNITDTGIESIFTDEAIEGGVYNLNGVYVGESLENLPAGIYVVKGHKVAVSK